MAKEIPNIFSLVNGIMAFVRESVNDIEIGEVERRLLPMVIEVGKRALEEFVAAKGTGYRGEEFFDTNGKRCPYVRTRDRQYRSIFGTISIRRAYYHARFTGNLSFGWRDQSSPERYSYVLQEFSSRLAVRMSYEDAQEILGSFLPVKMPIRSLESIVGER